MPRALAKGEEVGEEFTCPQCGALLVGVGGTVPAPPKLNLPAVRLWMACPKSMNHTGLMEIPRGYDWTNEKLPRKPRAKVDPRQSVIPESSYREY